MSTRKRPEELRSHRWLGVSDLRSFGHRSRLRQFGYDADDWAGRPVIGIINTWSEINACHAHLRARAENVKRGVLQAGKLRALAVTTSKRSDALPDVPTVADTVAGYEASAFFGMGVPKGTPAEIVDKLNKEINAALADPKMKAKLAELGGMLIPGTPDDFGKVVAEETEKWGKVIKTGGVALE